MTRSDVRAYYDSVGEREWVRLTRPDDGAVEFAVTCHAIADHLRRSRGDSRRRSTFELFDLRVIIEEIGGHCTCDHAVGDWFEVCGGKLSLPSHQSFWRVGMRGSRR